VNKLYPLTALTVLLFQGTALAGSKSYDASSMWGTSPSSAGAGALNSAAMHAQNGVVAGQVNAAEDGMLYANGTGGSYTIQSIGSQSVVNNNIIGDDNNVDIDADQNSSNSGAVTNNGKFGK
jgi:hypothetical protein